ncbi:hypothetical protein EMIT0324P_60026 [Pseudomonas chlororaphis]
MTASPLSRASLAPTEAPAHVGAAGRRSIARDRALGYTLHFPAFSIFGLSTKGGMKRIRSVDEIYVKVQYGFTSTKQSFSVSLLSSVLPNQQQPARERI